MAATLGGLAYRSSRGSGACGCGVADEDIDSDGIINCVDNCAEDENADQVDTDSDGVGDVCDNYPFAPNPQQEDADQDDVGTACDCADNEFFIGRIEGIAHYVDPATGVDRAATLVLLNCNNNDVKLFSRLPAIGN